MTRARRLHTMPPHLVEWLPADGARMVLLQPLHERLAAEGMPARRANGITLWHKSARKSEWRVRVRLAAAAAAAHTMVVSDRGSSNSDESIVPLRSRIDRGTTASVAVSAVVDEVEAAGSVVFVVVVAAVAVGVLGAEGEADASSSPSPSPLTGSDGSALVVVAAVVVVVVVASGMAAMPLPSSTTMPECERTSDEPDEAEVVEVEVAAELSAAPVPVWPCSMRGDTEGVASSSPGVRSSRGICSSLVSLASSSSSIVIGTNSSPSATSSEDATSRDGEASMRQRSLSLSERLVGNEARECLGGSNGWNRRRRTRESSSR